LSEVLKEIAEIAVEQLRKKKGRTPPKTITTDASKHCVADTVTGTKANTGDGNVNPSVGTAQRKGRYIPQETKRIVFARAGGRCEFVGSDGHRCASTYQLEVDHLQCWSQGGGNEADNLSLKCRSHNSYRTKETHGFLFNSRPLTS
jgi:hypothetical protein